MVLSLPTSALNLPANPCTVYSACEASHSCRLLILLELESLYMGHGTPKASPPSFYLLIHTAQKVQL